MQNLERFKSVIKYWCEVRGDEIVPEREKFHPSQISRMLARIMILERVDNDHFDIKLAGTEIVDRLGEEITHKEFLDYMSLVANRDETAGLLNAVLDHPVCMAGTRDWVVNEDEDESYNVYFLLLPFQHVDKAATEIFIVMDFDKPFNPITTRTQRMGRMQSGSMIDIGAGIPEEFANYLTQPLQS